MTTDLELTTDRDVNVPDTTGDAGTVTGRTNIEQQHANAVFRAYEKLNPTTLGRNAEEDFRIKVESELTALHYVDTYEITIESNFEAGELEVTIDTNALENPVVEGVTL